jgi:hypothetical protein
MDALLLRRRQVQLVEGVQQAAAEHHSMAVMPVMRAGCAWIRAAGTAAGLTHDGAGDPGHCQGDH